MVDLMQRLQQDAERFDFFQLMVLLEEYYRRGAPETEPLCGGHIRLVANEAMSFPGADIAAVHVGEEWVRVVLNFMGLVGASSPLPGYFAQEVVADGEDCHALRGFLEIFDHRLYGLFYQAWKKYRVIHATRGGEGAFVCMVRALGGCFRGEWGGDVLSQGPVWVGGQRSAEGVRRVVSEAFEGAGVQVRQWVGQWVEVEQLHSVGRGWCLGRSSVLGGRVWDVGGAFRVVIGPLSRGCYEGMLGGSAAAWGVLQRIRESVADGLAFDVELLVKGDELSPLCLGAAMARLGRTALLGWEQGKSHCYSVVLHQEEGSP
jgi:type VI secretion system protein ImpH